MPAGTWITPAGSATFAGDNGENNDAIPVVIDSVGQSGHAELFGPGSKTTIKPMDTASEAPLSRT